MQEAHRLIEADRERTRDSELALAGIIGRKQTWSLECMVTLCLAGPEAERKFCCSINEGSDRIDYRMAYEYLARQLNPVQIGAELTRYRDAAQRLVRSPWGTASHSRAR
jgi:hypothetical protein